MHRNAPSTKDGKTKKLTQLMMLMSLGVKQGDTVTVAANGEDEDAAIETLKAFSKQICKSTLGG